MYCQALREEVLATVENCIYFDNASIGPLLKTAGEKAAGFLRSKETLPMDYAALFGAAVTPCRGLVAQFIHAREEEIAFFGSVAQGVTVAAWTIPFEAGDNVILCDREFGSNVYPWMQMGKRRGVEVRIVPHDNGGLTLRRLQQYADSRTRAVAVSSVQFGDGYRADLAALGGWCRERGAYLSVDCAQSLGVLPMDVQAYNIDFLAGCGAKWMLAGFGTGFLYIGERLAGMEPPFPAADSMDKGPDSIAYDMRYKPTAARFETGALNLPGIAALTSVLETFHRIGPNNIYQAARDVGAYFVERLLSADIDVAPSARNEQTRSGIISFQLPDPEAAGKYLCEQGVACIPRIGYVRTGLHGYNTKDEVDRAMEFIIRAKGL